MMSDKVIDSKWYWCHHDWYQSWIILLFNTEMKYFHSYLWVWKWQNEDDDIDYISKLWNRLNLNECLWIFWDFNYDLCLLSLNYKR